MVVLFAAVFSWSPAIAQKQTALLDESSRRPHDTLARFGSTVITASDLTSRLELMPFPGEAKPNQVEGIKAKALHAMIAEKLLGQEAKRLGLPEDKLTKLMFRELENLFIRDELYKRVIAPTATPMAMPTEDEIAVGMKRLPHELQVLSFLVPTRAEGVQLSKALRAVPRGQSTSLYTQVDTISIRFGGPDVAYEEAAFAIGKSRVSKEFHSDNFGWAVLYLLDKHPNSDVAKLSTTERRHRVEKILRERNEGEMAGKYYYSLLQSKRARADERVFTLFADSVVALWKEGRFQRKGGYVLSSEMVEMMFERLKPYLDFTLVEMDDGGLTLGEVLEMFRYEDYLSKHLEGDAFKIQFNEQIKNLVAKELLAREGRQQNLHSSSPVQHDLQLWTDYIAAAALYNRVRDSVTISEEEIIHYLVKNKEVFGRYYEVNVREVLRNSLDDVKAVLDALHRDASHQDASHQDALQRGNALAQLAAEYSTRAEWVKNNGESGYFQVVQHPEIGVRALIADTGKLIGPVKLPEGYSMFMVLGKRRTKEAYTDFDTLKQNIRTRLLAEKRKQTLDRLIANLAREQSVSIAYDKVKNLKVNLAPMFTRRLIGFGGRMSAFPLLMQQWDWIEEFQQPGLP